VPKALEAIVRKLLLPLIVTLSLVTLPAHADRGYYDHGGHGYYGGGVSPWAGLAVFVAIAGMAVVAESSRPVYVDPYHAAPVPAAQTVYIEAQPEASAPQANPAGTWYYCGSSAMYYPYTKACPQGWQAVPARPY